MIWLKVKLCAVNFTARKARYSELYGGGRARCPASLSQAVIFRDESLWNGVFT